MYVPLWATQSMNQESNSKRLKTVKIDFLVTDNLKNISPAVTIVLIIRDLCVQWRS